jgi:hypothetical protein
LLGKRYWRAATAEGSLTFGPDRAYKPLVRGSFRFPGACFDGLNTQTKMFQEGPHTAVLK